MGSVSLFVKSIIIISFLWCLGESILPHLSLKKNFNFIYGIIIISMVFNLFLNFDTENLFEFEGSITDTHQSKEYLKEIYEQRLEQVLKDKYKNNSIEAKLTDDYKVQSIYCDDSEVYNKIMRDLNE